MVEQRTENPRVPSSILGPATSVWPKTKSGSSSGVEHNLAKVGVVGSNPIFRSRNIKGLEISSKPFLFSLVPPLFQGKENLLLQQFFA